jgi:hypothetical protein
LVNVFQYEKPKDAFEITVYGLDTTSSGKFIKELYEEDNIFVKVSTDKNHSDFIFLNEDIIEKMPEVNKDYKVIFYSQKGHDDELVAFNKANVKNVYYELFFYKYVKASYYGGSFLFENNHLKYLVEQNYKFSETDIIKDFIPYNISHQKTYETKNLFYMGLFIVLFIFTYILFIAIVRDYFKDTSYVFWKNFSESWGFFVFVLILNIIISPFVI